MRPVSALRLALLFGAPGLVGVQGGSAGLDVLPSLLEITQKAGDRFEREVTLSNAGDAPLPVSARVSDWSLAETGEVSFSEPGTLTGSCAGWIEVEPSAVVVPPHGRAAVKLTVRSPADAAGTHWAVVFFSLPEMPGSAQGRPVTYASRVGLTVYVTSEGTEREDFRLIDASSAESSVGKGIRLGALVENGGNTAVRFRVTWQIKSEDGKFVRSYEARSVVALPGSRREATFQVVEDIPAGSYLVTAMTRWGSRRWAAKDCRLTVRRGRAALAV